MRSINQLDELDLQTANTVSLLGEWDGSNSIPYSLQEQVSNEIYSSLKYLVDTQGYTTFLSGVARGFELFAAEAVLKLKTEGCKVQLILILNYADYELVGYDKEETRRYDFVLKNSTYQFYIKSQRCIDVDYNKYKNYYLVSNCSVLVYYGSRNAFHIKPFINEGTSVIKISTTINNKVSSSGFSPSLSEAVR